MRWTFFFASLALSGCAAGLQNFRAPVQYESPHGSSTAPPGYHYPVGDFDSPVPNDACESSYVNSPGVLSWLNSSISRPAGVRSKVDRVENSSDARVTDLLASGFPVGGSSFSCNATLIFEDGTSARGTFGIYDPGSSLPLQVKWADQAAVESAAEKADADRQVRSSKNIAYSENASSCGLAFSVGIQAKSLISAGLSEDQVVHHLITKYAYSQNGEAYKGSREREDVIRNIAANPEKYGSQDFLSQCMASARQVSR